ncbi:MAG TPA: tetratricopeptide repeat protein [Sphingomicrobium sp.]|nr:tetratricopeptide repeat protein [Sphingomicrobium sp.]
MRFRFAVPLAFAALAATPVLARTPPSPEERIGRLEKQVRQVQKQVFPKGQPADTAGFSDDPAATQSSVGDLGGRIDALERQLSELTRASEENGNRLGVIEADLARLKADQDARFRALENAGPAPATGASAAEPGGAAEADAPPAPRPKVETATTRPASGAFADPAEAAYDQGFRLWEAKKYDQSITSLRAMASSFPGHRRVSWANNLAGRALLEKGQPRAAAETLLANYRANPKGERAPDSLFYLGKSLVKLGQPAQACKAYDELGEIYGSTMRPALKSMIPAAKAEAKCK